MDTTRPRGRTSRRKQTKHRYKCTLKNTKKLSPCGVCWCRAALTTQHFAVTRLIVCVRTCVYVWMYLKVRRRRLAEQNNPLFNVYISQSEACRVVFTSRVALPSPSRFVTASLVLSSLESLSSCSCPYLCLTILFPHSHFLHSPILTSCHFNFSSLSTSFCLCVSSTETDLYTVPQHLILPSFL